MKNKLWQTSNGGLHPLVEAFTVGDDYIFDQQLLPYDIQASKAHAEMLFEMNIINQKEFAQAKQGLQEIIDLWGKDKFSIQKSQEDGHTAIEQYLTEKHGEVGKKIHTGRSRNDQSLVMIRLFMKEKLLEIQKEVNELIASFQKKAEDSNHIPMPGYTHIQKAMPTKVGVWLDSFSAALQDFQGVLNATTSMIDQNPLGSASGFGIENFPLKREITTQKLGFGKTQENPMYCGFSRGFFENTVLQTLSQPMIIAGKFANDMMLFTTQEFNFFSLPNEFTTGSSIMPQKRNYDVFEIMRGNVKVFTSYQIEIQQIVSSIGSGYQRDLQLTKKPFVLGINLCLDTIVLLSTIIQSLKINQQELDKAMSQDLYVTNKVYELVKKGMSFREAYVEVKEAFLEKK
jgi:argininosuccinate lyase